MCHPTHPEQVDHVAAIKEYSRSSADQEEPLPYELRPLTVLSMTMNYLVSQIMDQSHDNYRDWYDFVWNRTRGIRKVSPHRLVSSGSLHTMHMVTGFCRHAELKDTFIE